MVWLRVGEILSIGGCWSWFGNWQLPLWFTREPLRRSVEGKFGPHILSVPCDSLNGMRATRISNQPTSRTVGVLALLACALVLLLTGNLEVPSNA